MPNNLKEMTAVEIMKYIRTLEEQTNAERVDPDRLDGMTFFEWEDLVVELEKKRDLRLVLK